MVFFWNSPSKPLESDSNQPQIELIPTLPNLPPPSVEPPMNHFFNNPLPSRPPPSLDTASLFSKIFFTWVTPFINLGLQIGEHNLPDLQDWDQADFLYSELVKHWDSECLRVESAPYKNKNIQPSLIYAIIKTFKWQIFWSGLWSALEIMAKIGEALILGEMITSFRTSNAQSSVVSLDNYWWAFGLTLTTTVHAILHHALFFIGMRLGLQIRVALTSLMYQKAIHLKAGSASSGLVVNLISNDTAPLEQLSIFGHYLWVVLIEIPVCAWLLYERLSWPSLIGLLFIFLNIPFQGIFGTQFKKFRIVMVKWRDSRIRLMSDLLTGINVVKFNAWKTPFVRELSNIRAKEMKYLRRAGFMDALNEASFFAFPMLVFLLTFVPSVMAGIPLSAPAIYSSVALFNILRLDMTVFLPKAVRFATESMVSSTRIRNFLLEDESTTSRVKENNIDVFDMHTFDPDPNLPAITFANSTFSWPAFFLANISHIFKQTSLTAIIGPVGSGKSSLILSILGEMPGSESSPPVLIDSHHRRMAYAPQSSWILAGPIVDNIVFGASLDQPWLDRVVNMCALERDIEQWPNGLHTIIGDRGVALSGGQRARVGLARAIYARMPVLLLDDPLSAVDTRVARHIFDSICNAPELQNVTRILITHQLQFVKECKNVIVMDTGRIVASGTWDSILNAFKDRVKHDGPDVANKEWLSILVQYDESPNESDISEDVDIPNKTVSSIGQNNAVTDVGVVLEEQKNPVVNAGESPNNDMEVSQVGNVKWSTFRRFLLENTSWSLLLISIVSTLAGQVLAVSSDFHLAKWVGLPPNVQLNDPFYLYLYWGLVWGAIVFGVVRALLVYHLLFTASTNTSANMLEKVLDAPLSWFARNPTGRVLNRFTRDLSLTDEMLPSIFFNFLQCLLLSFGVIVVVIIVIPWLALSVPILGYVFVRFRQAYIAASREIKRIESTARSPMYSHLSSSLDGLAVIRAMKAQPMFICRFSAFVDANTRALFLQSATARWLGLHLDLTSASFTAIAAFGAQIVAQFGGLNAALAGLALSYTLQLNGLLQWMVRQSVECEIAFVSVERMLEYCDLDGEAGYASQVIPPPEWPMCGDLKISNMSLTYPGDPRPVLCDWNVTFLSGERIGVVGRTGAGKSSFFSALFRTYEYKGCMELDQINTATVRVEELRKRLSIIPQEPFLFKGTLRFNLDPFQEYEDVDLWRALDRVELKKVIELQADKLNALVEDGGSNFSVGQRQLICLARSLLKQSKVLVCDEATANIDFRSDALIQNVLKTSFPETLVLTIAHRLSTVIDYDRIMVLDAGQIVEIGHAHELLKNVDGYFLKMIRDMGEENAQQLHDKARDSWNKRAHTL